MEERNRTHQSPYGQKGDAFTPPCNKITLGPWPSRRWPILVPSADTTDPVVSTSVSCRMMVSLGRGGDSRSVRRSLRSKLTPRRHRLVVLQGDAAAENVGSFSRTWPSSRLPQSMTTTEEPTIQAPQQPRHGESVKHLPERLSRRNRKHVSKLSSIYRNPMVKQEPEPHNPHQD